MTETSDKPFSHTLLATDGAARRGRYVTPHGPIETPAFMAVGTQGSVKGMTPDRLREIGAQILLSNTYHLHIRPGESVVRELGDLHGFMAWEGPILTDSGGYQVFSLGHLNDVEPDGVRFRSHVDGAEVFIGPRESMAIQEALGADIIMAFDHCETHPCTRDEARAAMERTHRWARLCLEAHSRPDQALFGIVQGSTFEDLRRESSETLVALPFDGYAIGGLSVGEGREAMHEVLSYSVDLLPDDRPRYLMGVGPPEDIFEAVGRGVDLFDCVVPTRNARNGQAFTRDGIVRIRNAHHRRDRRPLASDCTCYTCQTYSRGVLRHLQKRGEILGSVLITLHNLAFYYDMMQGIRTAIETGTFETHRTEFLERYLANTANG